MLGHKQDQWQETHASSMPPVSGTEQTRHPAVSRLIEYLEAFDYFLFLYDPVYRQQADGLLNLLTEEEFAAFERTYAQRLPMN